VKYRNAMEILPPQLLRQLQELAQGEILYVPKAKRETWGAATGARAFYSERDCEIRKQFSRGAGLEKLGEKHFISEDAVKKIVYGKGEKRMKENVETKSAEIDYGKYYWQNDMVRARRARVDDWKHHHRDVYDSDERFFTDYAQELPQDEDLAREDWENYVNAHSGGDKRALFIFETHSGKYVGGGNLHGINERNGTFGMFVGAVEERYALAGARLMLDYAFNERRLNNCHTGFIENDTVFKPVFEKLGFKLEGIRRQQIFHKGRFWDEHLYGLLAAEFNAQ